jgi:hypothetical protein
MPTKNFFSPLLALACSSYHPFLYTTHKHPLSDYSTGMSLNCNLLNHSPIPDSLTSTSLNCNLTQTPHDMPSSLDGDFGLFGYWPDDMPSSHPDPLDPFRYLSHLRHLGLLSHLGCLGTISNLNALDLEPIDLSLHAFIEEEDT